MARVVYEASVPEEPPVGTVVLDSNEVAWQRVGMANLPYPSWVSTRLNKDFHDLSADYWPKLLTERGPLKELYRPLEEN